MNLQAADFLGVWGFLALNVASPGPNVMNTIATAMAGGRAAGLASAAGVGVGLAGWSLGAATGMAALFAAWPPARGVLTLVAVGLLLWFASRYLRAALAGWRGHLGGLPVAKGPAGIRSAFLRSLTVNALNPKALTSWIALLSLFPVARAGVADVAVLGAGAVAVGVAIHGVYALVFSTPVAAMVWLRAGWAVSGVAGVFFGTVALGLLGGLVQNR